MNRPENVLRLAWQPGQLVLFDNRITQHYAIDNYDDLPRRLNRVTVAGDIPVGVDGQQSYSVRGDASHYTPVRDHGPCRGAAGTMPEAGRGPGSASPESRAGRLRWPWRGSGGSAATAAVRARTLASRSSR